MTKYQQQLQQAIMQTMKTLSYIEDMEYGNTSTTELEKLSNIGAAQAQYIPCIEELQSRHVKLFGVRFVPTEEQFKDVLVV